MMKLKRCRMILTAVLTMQRLFVLSVPFGQFELLPFAPLDSFLFVCGVPDLFVIRPMKLLTPLRILKWRQNSFLHSRFWRKKYPRSYQTDRDILMHLRRIRRQILLPLHENASPSFDSNRDSNARGQRWTPVHQSGTAPLESSTQRTTVMRSRREKTNL